MRTRLVPLLAVLALLAPACSDDDDSASDTTTTTAEGAGETTDSTAAGGGGEQDARRIVLQQSDFPAGWTSTPAEPDDEEDDESDAAFNRCLGAELSDDDEGSVESPDFAMGDLLQASSTADIVESDAVIEADWRALQSEKLLPCMEKLLAEELRADAEGVQFADLKAERMDYPEVGDGSMAVRVTTAITAEGETAPLYLDLVFIRKGRAELSLNLFGLGEPFPADLAADLGRALAGRA